MGGWGCGRWVGRWVGEGLTAVHVWGQCPSFRQITFLIYLCSTSYICRGIQGKLVSLTLSETNFQTAKKQQYNKYTEHHADSATWNTERESSFCAAWTLKQSYCIYIVSELCTAKHIAESGKIRKWKQTHHSKITFQNKGINRYLALVWGEKIWKRKKKKFFWPARPVQF